MLFALFYLDLTYPYHTLLATIYYIESYFLCAPIDAPHRTNAKTSLPVPISNVLVVAEFVAKGKQLYFISFSIITDAGSSMGFVSIHVGQHEWHHIEQCSTTWCLCVDSTTTDG